MVVQLNYKLSICYHRICSLPPMLGLDGILFCVIGWLMLVLLGGISGLFSRTPTVALFKAFVFIVSCGIIAAFLYLFIIILLNCYYLFSHLFCTVITPIILCKYCDYE